MHRVASWIGTDRDLNYTEARSKNNEWTALVCHDTAAAPLPRLTAARVDYEIGTWSSETSLPRLLPSVVSIHLLGSVAYSILCFYYGWARCCGSGWRWSGGRYRRLYNARQMVANDTWRLILQLFDHLRWIFVVFSDVQLHKTSRFSKSSRNTKVEVNFVSTRWFYGTSIVNTLSLALESLLILRRCKLSVEMIFRNTVLRSIISGFITGFLNFFTLIFHFHWSNIRQLGPPNWFGIASWSNSGVFTCGTAQTANITVDDGVLIKAATMRCDNTLAWTTVANDSSAFSCLRIKEKEKKRDVFLERGVERLVSMTTGATASIKVGIHNILNSVDELRLDLLIECIKCL